MFKCSTEEGKTSCPCSSKLTWLVIALIAIILAAVWIFTNSGNLTAKEPAKETTRAPLVEKAEAPAKITVSTKLTKADLAAAHDQGKCPVMETLLSGKKKPIKISYGDQDAFVCCAGCVGAFKASPDRYLANLQGTCPVSGVALSTVENPVKLNHNGKDVYVKCNKCKKEFIDNPDRYLANCQGACPVSGVALSTVENPVKLNHNGKDLYVKCNTCKKEFLDNPDKYQKDLKK